MVKTICWYEHRAKKKAKYDFEKHFFNLMNNGVFGKTIQNERKQRDIKLVTNESRKYYLVSEHNYHTTKIFSGNWLAIELKRTQIIMNKSVYLGLSIVELSNIAMYTFWYDCVKPKCG